MMNISRRAFLKKISYCGTAIAFPLCGAELSVIISPFSSLENLGPFIAVDCNNNIYITATWAEMGTGSRTVMPMLIAEELDVDFQRISVIESTYTDYKKYGSQGGGASAAVRGKWTFMRQVGARIREVFVKSAAIAWGIDTSHIATDNGRVINTVTKNEMTYGQLLNIAKTIELSKSPPLKQNADFRNVGQNTQQLALSPIVTGKAIFGIDTAKPHMLYCCLNRSPWKQAELTSYEDDFIEKDKHLLKTIVIEGEKADWGTHVFPSVGVVAKTQWAALRAKSQMNAKWKNTGDPHVEPQMQELSELSNLAPVISEKSASCKKGDAHKAFSAEYHSPAVAHAQIEPLNCVARWTDNKLSVSGPFQSPTAVIHLLARRFKLSMTNIAVETTRIGGSFGRKQAMDFVFEAVLVAQQVPGTWVKTLWTREDDFACTGIRGAFYHNMKAEVSQTGELLSWEHTTIRGNGDTTPPKDEQSAGSYQGQSNFPYLAHNKKFSAGFYQVNCNEASHRGVYYPPNLFAVNCFLDEIATSLNQDPVAFHIARLGNQTLLENRTNYFEIKEPNATENRHLIYDIKRQLHVIDVVIKSSNWHTKNTKGWGFACGLSFSSYLAVVVKMKPDDSGAIEHIWTAIDCGQVVNPDGLINQLQGGAVWAISKVLHEHLTFSDGKIAQSNFHQYKVANMSDVPDITPIIIESDFAPTGVGEPVVACVAPAIINAMRDLSNTNLRSLPISNTRNVKSI